MSDEREIAEPAEAVNGVAGRSTVDDSIEVVLVTMSFEASAPDALLALLANYVVLTRQQAGCRNVDLCSSITQPDRFVVIQKWIHDAARQAHFDSAVMVDMAQACAGLLSRPPEIDLLEGLSAHDLN